MGFVRRLVAVGTVVGVAVMGAPVAAGAAPPGIVIENGVTQPVFSYDDAIQEVVYVEAPMDSDGDGRRDLIEVDVIRPAETAAGMRVPTIMEASPYFGRDAGDPPPDRTRGFPGWWDEYFVPRGYAIVQVEMQGTGRSFGCPTTGGVEDTTSIKAVVDWLNGRAPGFHHDGSAAVADWSTGNVGMQGVSYVGTLPNAVATQGVPGLRTVVPIAAISSWYRYVNDQGVAWSTWSENVDFRYTEYLADYVSVGRTLPGSASAPACESVITGLGDAEEASASDFTPFWQERSYLPDGNKIKTVGTSVFMVHGLTDYNVKTMHFADLWREVERRQMPRKIWLHRGAHVNPMSVRPAEWQAVMHRWMDYWLYDIPNGVMDEPMADIQRPDGSWETHATWPVAGPTYHFTDGARAAGDMSVLADSLPFNYTFEYELSMESRRFKTTTGKVCNWTDVYSTKDITIDLWVDTFGTDVQQGVTANFPAAGGTLYYCWTGLNNNNTYYLWFHKGWAQGAGSVTSS